MGTNLPTDNTESTESRCLLLSMRPLNFVALFLVRWGVQRSLTRVRMLEDSFPTLGRVESRRLRQYFRSPSIKPVEMDIVEQDIKLAIGWFRMNMRVCGIWPDPSILKKEEHMSKYQFALVLLLLLFFLWAPQAIGLVIIWGNVDLMIKILSLSNISVFNILMKMCVTRSRRAALAHLTESFIADWRNKKTEGERAVMLKNALMARRISIGCITLALATLAFFVLIHGVTIAKVGRNSTDRMHLMPYTGYFPYDLRKSPAFELTYCGQIVAAILGVMVYTSVDTFISMLALHACGQFTNLQKRLENLFDECSRDLTKRQKMHAELVTMVQKQENLIWFVKTIEACFNELLFGQMMVCTLEICFQGFEIAGIIDGSEYRAAQLLFFAAFVGFILVHLYVYCYIGEKLFVQHSKLSQSVYDSRWYDVPAKEAKVIIIIMLRSTVPLRLTAGKFGTFSLEMFSNILKTSMGYLSVLLTVTKQ